MLTPGYSPTATERVLPRLALDFTTASLDSRVTVTRALNTATRFNSSGFLETVNADLPRFDYTLNTGGACKGLLIEDTKQNICLYSTDLTNVSWNTYSGETSIAANGGISIDGTNNAFRVTGVSGLGRLGQTFTVLANTAYTFSFYVKNVTATVVSYFDTVSGASVNYVSQINTSTWTRLSKTVTTGAATTSLTVQFVRDLPVGQSVLICCPQVEANSFASSVILTGATAVTRNADAVSMTGTNFSSWYNATEGTFVVNANTIVLGGTRVIVASSTANVLLSYIQSSNRFGAFDGTNTAWSANAISANTPFKGATAYNASNMFSCLNAGAVVSSAYNNSFSTVPGIYLGSNIFGGYLNGQIRSINYYPLRLTDAQLQAFTK